MSSEYDDILALPRHSSVRRKHMSLSDRAAQFAPFAALSGYGDSIAEKGRQTSPRINLAADQRELLDRKLQYLSELQSRHPWILAVCYLPDAQKSGGFYEQVSGVLKKIDPVQRSLVLEPDTHVPLDNIMDILLIKEAEPS